MTNKIKAWKKEGKSPKGLDKVLVDISDPWDCRKDHGKRTARERLKWGVSYCDTYGMDTVLGNSLHNVLLSYLHYADKHIVLTPEFKTDIKRHAKAIREYGQADSWEGCRPKKNRFSMPKWEANKKKCDAFAADPENKKKPYSPVRFPKSLYGDKAYAKEMKAYAAFRQKEKAWKEAMQWLTKNLHSLWW